MSGILFFIFASCELLITNNNLYAGYRFSIEKFEFQNIF